MQFNWIWRGFADGEFRVLDSLFVEVFNGVAAGAAGFICVDFHSVFSLSLLLDLGKRWVDCANIC